MRNTRKNKLQLWLLALLLLLMPVFGSVALALPTDTQEPSPANHATDALPAGVHDIVMIEGIQEYRLDNGLRILLAPDQSRAKTTVLLHYAVGSRHEGPGQTGMAHLLEHLIFRGSKNFPQAHAEFSRRGLAANGSTSDDQTNYYASFASQPETLHWYLSWAADAMVNASFDEADLKAEMTVVRNEMERGENSPFAMLMQQVNAISYVWHPYGRSVIGARSDVENVDIAQLRNFYRHYYQPDNATVVVSGNFDQAQVLQWIVTLFGDLPRPDRTLQPGYTVEPVQEGPRFVSLRRAGGSPIALVQYHLPAASSDQFTALSIGISMLADAPAGPLYQGLVPEAMASMVFGYARPMFQPGYALFGARIPPEADPQKTLQTLESIIESGGIDALDEIALERIRTAWLNDWQQVLLQPESLAQALSAALSLGDWRMFFIERLRVQALTIEEVKRTLASWLVPDNRSSGLYLPDPHPKNAPQAEPGKLQTWIDQLETGTRRPGTEAVDTSPEGIDAATQRSTLNLSGGPVTLALLPRSSPGQQIHLVMQLRSGTLGQMSGLGLIPQTTAAMLLRGSRQMDRQAIEDQLNQLDTDLGFSQDDNVLTVSLRSSRDHLPKALELMFQVLREPAFPQEELDKIKRSMLTSLQDRAASPSFLVRNTLQRLGQPWDSNDIRYVPSLAESARRVRSLTREQLQQFHAKFHGPGNILLAAVGDFDADDLVRELTAGLENWPSAAAYERIPQPWYPIDATVIHIPVTDKANAEYMAYLPLKIQDDDPRWPALILANYLLGGSQDSRLWNAVRETDGLSYSVGSSIQASSWQPSGQWTLFASMAAENSEALADSIRQTLKQTLRSGFSQAEVDQAVTSLLQYMKLGRSSDSSLAWRWAGYLDTGRSFAWQNRIQNELKQIKAEDVNRIMREFLQPDALGIAIAADPVRAGTASEMPEQKTRQAQKAGREQKMESSDRTGKEPSANVERLAKPASRNSQAQKAVKGPQVESETGDIRTQTID